MSVIVWDVNINSALLLSSTDSSLFSFMPPSAWRYRKKTVSLKLSVDSSKWQRGFCCSTSCSLCSGQRQQCSRAKLKKWVSAQSHSGCNTNITCAPVQIRRGRWKQKWCGDPLQIWIKFWRMRDCHMHKRIVCIQAFLPFVPWPCAQIHKDW